MTLRCVYHPGESRYVALRDHEPFVSYQRNLRDAAEVEQAEREGYEGCAVGDIIDLAGPQTHLATWTESYGPEDFERHCVLEAIETPEPIGLKILGPPSIEVVEGVLTQVWSTRALTAEELGELRDGKVRQIKAECRRRIVARFSLEKQANMTARAAALTDIRIDRPWTAEEQAQADFLRNAWPWIKGMREACAAAAAAAMAADAEALAAVDPTAWPSPAPPAADPLEALF